MNEGVAKHLPNKGIFGYMYIWLENIMICCEKTWGREREEREREREREKEREREICCDFPCSFECYFFSLYAFFVIHSYIGKALQRIIVVTMMFFLFRIA